MALQQDIITFIRKKGEAVKASELALAFDLTKTEINSELYSLQGIILQRTESNPPYWSFLHWKIKFLILFLTQKMTL